MNDNPQYSPAILERDWQLFGNRLRAIMMRSLLKLEKEIDSRDGDDYVVAQALEKLATAGLHACYLDIAAASLEARVGREGKSY